MSRQLEGIEKGFRIYLENSDVYVDALAGSAAPTGTGEQASAPIGSTYQRIGTGEFYQKKTNVGNAGDWIAFATGSTLTRWRSELADVITDDVIAIGTRDVIVSPLSDDDDGLVAADFIVGHYVISDADGTPTLLEVTNVAGDDVTFAAANALVDGDAFIVSKYLPDGAGQENKALVVFSDGIMKKLADIDWNFATGISLSSGFTKANGTVTSADSVETAIEKMAANQEDLTTLSGVAQGSTDFGTFTGSIIPDAQNTKQALQALETDAELEKTKVANLVTLSGQPVNSTDHGTMDQGTILSDAATTTALFKEADAEMTRQKGKSTAAGVVALAVIDSVLVDDVTNAQWQVTIEQQSAPVNKKHFVVFAGHNGHAGADASAVDDNISKILKQGASFNAAVSVAISGTGVAQAMELKVSSSEAGGVNVYAKRIETLF